MVDRPSTIRKVKAGDLTNYPMGKTASPPGDIKKPDLVSQARRQSTRDSGTGHKTYRLFLCNKKKGVVVHTLPAHREGRSRSQRESKRKPFRLPKKIPAVPPAVEDVSSSVR